MKFVVVFILIAVAIFFVRKFLSKFKIPKVSCIAMFTGAPKTGKSALCLASAHSEYRAVRFRWRLSCLFIRFLNFFKKKGKKIILPEEPLLYSNIPLRGMKYCKVTTAHLLRLVRFNEHSVLFLDEASLIADSRLVNNNRINTQLLLFFKLFGHSCGGKIYINSQTISDVHYAIKRCVSNYFYIHHTYSFIPFVACCKVREERYCDDNTSINTYTEDIENSVKTVFFRKSTFKKYDYRCFSVLTDSKPVKNLFRYNKKGDSLKMKNIISFRREFRDIKQFELSLEELKQCEKEL